MNTLEAKIYNQQGKSAGTMALPAHVFGLPWNADLVHQTVVSMMTSARTPVAHSRMRGEVSGGGKKPWQQKGTGRARHGSTRSPLWVGGGVTHGPRNDKNFFRKVNKKMKTKALYTILSKKLRDGEVIFVDSITPSEAKTKNAMTILRALSGIEGKEMLTTKDKNAAFIGTSEKSVSSERAFGNIRSVEVAEIRNMNPLDLMKYKFVVIDNPKLSLEALAGKLHAKAVEGQVVVKKAKVAKPVKAVKLTVKKTAPAKKAPSKVAAKAPKANK